MSSVIAEGLRKVYRSEGVIALDGVSFSITPGEAVAVIGPSGAGKTTLFRILTRTIPLESGRVEIDGVDLYRAGYLFLGSVRRRIGLVYQRHNLVTELSALQNAAMGMIGCCSTWRAIKSLAVGLSGEERRIVEEALGRVGLTGKGEVRASNLSGGEQQRLAIARLLVQNPDLVLADEPVASIDPSSSQRIMEVFKELNEEGKTVICNLHDVELALSYFPRIIAISQGRLVFDGPPSKLTAAVLTEIYRGGREAHADETAEPCICVERLARRGLEQPAN